MKWTPLTTPTTNPLQAAVRSTAKAPFAPIAACTVHADPNRSSGDDVERRMRSISSASTPAISSAFLEASAASEVRDSSPEMTCLLPMPVRVRIHSSLVSTSSERSSLVRYCAGTAMPTPAIFAPAGVNAALATRDAPRARVAGSRGARVVIVALTGLRAPALSVERACALTENADIESVAIILVQSTQPPRVFFLSRLSIPCLPTRDRPVRSACR